MTWRRSLWQGCHLLPEGGGVHTLVCAPGCARQRVLRVLMTRVPGQVRALGTGQRGCVLLYQSPTLGEGSGEKVPLSSELGEDTRTKLQTEEFLSVSEEEKPEPRAFRARRPLRVGLRGTGRWVSLACAGQQARLGTARQHWPLLW